MLSTKLPSYLLAVTLLVAMPALLTAQPPDPVLDELLPMRQELLGEGLFDDAEAEQAFREEFRRLAREENRQQQQERTGRSRRAAQMPTTEPKLDHEAIRKRQMLRETAFELDKLAHRLETAEAFRHADQLREVAGAMRQEARPEEARQPHQRPDHQRPGINAKGPRRH